MLFIYSQGKIVSHRPFENSRSSHARAKKHMPLGVADSYRFWEDETVFIKSMSGGTITDVDDNTYMDFRLCYGPIILGYRDKRVDKAVIDCIQNVGSMVGFSLDIESQVCELIKSMCPNIEKLRFANSGTEAVLGAIRTARGYTKRERLIVIEGGFHGLFDEMMWKSDVEGWNKQKENAPPIIPFGGGLTAASRALVELIPLNDYDQLEEKLKDKSIAAVIIEPIMGNCGSIMATTEYMKALRKLCTQTGTALIVDEVKTGFRVAKGGVQELYGVHADLTTYAKAMGNGYPVAAFGGKSELMDCIHFGEGGVTHGGTYTANLVGMAAAKQTLSIIKDTDALQTINHVGSEIQKILKLKLNKYGIPCTFSGPDSMFGIHFGDCVPQNYRDWRDTKPERYVRFAKHLIDLGVMVEPDSREPWFICEAHKDLDLNHLAALIDTALAQTE
ncbi:MAG: aspartate aminotransferase family protein [Proteobacteria bacterium]|nr:aspartate aminotransferase family protein [Pseudomonadota bacterium]